MRRIMTKAQQEAADRKADEMEALFNSRKHVPKKQVLKCKPGTWVVLKWTDGQDTVALMLDKPQGGDIDFRVLMQPTDDKKLTTMYVEYNQVVEIRGQIEWPALILGPKA